MVLLYSMEEFCEQFLVWWKYIKPYTIDFVIIVAILFVVKKISKPITNLVRKACIKARIDRGVTSFFCSLTHFIIALVAVLVILSVVGVSSATIATAVASCSLAIGLALQGTLQNFAGGVLILILKPFIAGDYIKVGNYEGTVVSIDICYTKMLTYDNQEIVLPNGQLSNSNLVNVFKEPIRRVDIKLPISYSDDIRAVRLMLLKLYSEEDRIIKTKPLEFFVDKFGDSSVDTVVRIWVKSNDYWPISHEFIERIKYAIDENGFTIPFGQLDVTIKSDEN